MILLLVEFLLTEPFLPFGRSVGRPSLSKGERSPVLQSPIVNHCSAGLERGECL